MQNIEQLLNRENWVKYLELATEGGLTDVAIANDIVAHINEALSIANVVGQSEQCSGCDESTGETKLWCCNHCGKRIEDF